MRRQVIIYTDENGEWCASCPSLPGCHLQGETREETVANIRDAIEAYIEALVADGLLVPPETENREILTLDVAA